MEGVEEGRKEGGRGEITLTKEMREGRAARRGGGGAGQAARCTRFGKKGANLPLASLTRLAGATWRRW